MRYPLYPTIFAMAKEPLANAIWTHFLIQVILLQNATDHLKISGFFVKYLICTTNLVTSFLSFAPLASD